jgi:hypothetical protein
MNEFVAILRVKTSNTDGPIPSFSRAVQACQAALPGVLEASFDAAAHSLEFRFDRTKASVADIVRCLEDSGLSVTAVAQTKADSRIHAASA